MAEKLIDVKQTASGRRSPELQIMLVASPRFEPARIDARVRKSWEQLGNNCVRTPVKGSDQGRPATKTSQQVRRLGAVCKTSTPGSNPGGASNFT
jgi:hypothetical protein